MIHLCKSEEFKSLCGAQIIDGNILTRENPPHHRSSKNLCFKCKSLYDSLLKKELKESHERYSEWKRNRTFKDRLEGLANIGEGSRPDFYLIPILASGGLLLVGKHIAKFVLKAFYNE